MDEAAFFDKIAPTWDDNEILSTPEKINDILNLMDIKTGQDVLDLGTGTGVLLPYIAQRIGSQGSILAVDYSSGMLERAKLKFSSISPAPAFLKSDFEKDTIEGEFDHIILYCVYPHLHTPVDTLRWLAKVNLKDNGMISIAFPCGPDFINNIHREKHSESDFLPSASELASRLRSHGLNAQVASDTPASYVINILK